MTIQQRTLSGVVVLAISGNLTTSGMWANRLSGMVRRALQDGHRRLLLDMRHVRDVDSAGLGDLVEAYAATRNLGGAMKLLNVTRRLNELLVQTRLRRIFECFEDAGEAFASFDESTVVNPGKWEDEGGSVAS